MFRMNVRTTWTLYQAVVPILRSGGGGSLVGVGSVAGLRAGAEVAAYAAAKAGVMRLTESLAEELRPDRIRVNAVLPTTIDTPQNRTAMPGADTSRWVTPSEVAEAMLFLLSDAASAVSGALLQVG
jgi:3-oxoacyl-[acyl-carrier protein] reductase